jgi:anti-sigma factor RsiW
MRCGDARRRFTLHLEDRLAAAERTRLAEHLSACARCRAELARWEGVAGALRARGPTPAPAGLTERVFRAAMAERARPPLAAWFVGAARKAVLAGAVAAVAVWLGVLASGGAPELARAPAPAPSQAGLAALAADDPMELATAVQLWTAEGGDDGP